MEAWVDIKHENIIDDILGIETDSQMGNKRSLLKSRESYSPLNLKSSTHLFKINYHLQSSYDSWKLLAKHDFFSLEKRNKECSLSFKSKGKANSFVHWWFSWNWNDSQMGNKATLIITRARLRRAAGKLDAVHRVRFYTFTGTR